MIVDKVLVIASAFIQNKQGEVLLLKRSKKSSYPGHWQLVEGKLEDNEIPINTLKREVVEEVGTKVTRATFRNVFFNEIEAGGCNYLIIRAVYNTRISLNSIKISNEHTAFGWHDSEEIQKLALLPGTEKVLAKML